MEVFFNGACGRGRWAFTPCMHATDEDVTWVSFILFGIGIGHSVEIVVGAE